jgi:Bacterial TSP3 repeat
VLSLDGETGSERWRREVAGTGDYLELGLSVKATTDGAVIVGGFLDNQLPPSRLAVLMRLSASDGTEQWRTTFPSGRFDSIVLDRLDNPVAAGQLAGANGDIADFAVVKVSALTGADFVDTDGDGLSDADEVVRGTDPGALDTDRDAMNDGDEVEAGTDPTNPDSDGDGVPDGAETLHGLVQGAPESALHSSGSRTAFLSRLDAIFAAIAAGDTQGAADELRSLRRWVDGCEATPPAADHDDKVTDCALQDQIRAQIDLLLAALSG